MLRAVFPNGRFSPPATEASVASAEAMLGIRLPESLRQLYFVCDGFREDRGNAKYLFSLTEQVVVGSLVSITKFLWTEIAKPNLRAFVFFGSSSGDEYWGINRLAVTRDRRCCPVREPRSHGGDDQFRASAR